MFTFFPSSRLVPATLIGSLLVACSASTGSQDAVDLNVRFTESHGLDKGDKVEFGGVNIGEVTRVVAGDEDVTVELRLDPDKAGVVQKNAAAVVSGLGDPHVRIINPKEQANPETLAVKDGDSLRALNSSLEEAAWHTGKAIGMVESVLQQAARSFNDYMESEDWQGTKRNVEESLKDLGEQSSEAAESIQQNVEEMMAELEAQSGATIREAEKHFSEIEKQFRELGAKSGKDVIQTLEQFLEHLRAALESARRERSGQTSV